jgi:hypothetical protein
VTVPLDPSAVRAALADDGGNPLSAFASDVDGPPGTHLPQGAPALVDAVWEWMGRPERRVAASLVVLGYSARLLGPTVRLAHAGVLVDARPGAVRYSFAAGVGFRLSLPSPTGWSGPLPAVAARWCRDVVDEHLGLLIESVRADTPVAAALLWGNVASGLVGAARACGARAFLDAVREHGPLRGAGSFPAGGAGADGIGGFLRRTCCLYYRLPGGGYCGDCPLPHTKKGPR